MKIHALALVAALAAAGVAADVSARQSNNQSATAVPPALQAAINSGNPTAITQVIQTLSAGNPQRAAELARLTMQAAERLLATNPELAVRVAAAASNVLGQRNVQQAAPADTQAAAEIAARIMISPQVARLSSAELSGVSAFVAAVQPNRGPSGSPASSGSAGSGAGSGSGSGGGGGSAR